MILSAPQDTGAGVLEGKAVGGANSGVVPQMHVHRCVLLIGELHAVDALTAGTVSGGKVTTLAPVLEAP